MYRLRIFYAADDGGAAGAEAPAAAPEAAAPAPAAEPAAGAAPTGRTSAAAQAAAGQPFFTYGDRPFASAEDLTRHLDRETLMKKGHDNASRELAEQRRAFESERDGQRSALEEAQRKAQQYDALAEAINGNAETRNWFRQQFQRQPTAADARAGAQSDIEQAVAQARAEMDEQYAPMREFYEEQQREQQRESAIETARQQFGEGFPEEAIRADLDALVELPEENWVEGLILTLARARGGALAQPGMNGAQAAQVPPGTRRPGQAGAQAVPESGARQYQTPAELAQAQKAALGLKGHTLTIGV